MPPSRDANDYADDIEDFGKVIQRMLQMYSQIQQRSGNRASITSSVENEEEEASGLLRTIQETVDGDGNY